MKDWKELQRGELKQLCEQHNMNLDRVLNRRRIGWTLEEALNTPLGCPRCLSRPLIADVKLPYPNLDGRTSLWA